MYMNEFGRVIAEGIPKEIVYVFFHSTLTHTPLKNGYKIRMKKKGNTLRSDLFSAFVNLKVPVQWLYMGAPLQTIIKVSYFFSLYYPINLTSCGDSTFVLLNEYHIRRPFRQYILCIG